MSINKEIKDSMNEKKLVIGTRDVTSHAKKGQLKKIIHSNNIPLPMLKQLQHYSKISSIEMAQFEGDSLMLGQVCSKPFKILSLGIKR